MKPEDGLFAFSQLFRFPCPVLGAKRTLPIAAPPDAAAPGVGSFVYAGYPAAIVQWRLVVWFEWGERESF